MVTEKTKLEGLKWKMVVFNNKDIAAKSGVQETWNSKDKITKGRLQFKTILR